MLLCETADVVWNPRNKKHYVDLGYEFTGMGSSFTVKVNDLTKGSQAYVSVKCDYCGCEYTVQWYTYLFMKMRSSINKDCCKGCLTTKAADAVHEKYGGYSEMFSTSSSKRRQTNIEKYGSENPFGSDEVKEKIVSTNIKKYGVPYTQSSSLVRQKTIATCNERYGVDNYIELFKGKFIKENSPVWKGGVDHSRSERASYEYNQWRTSVFSRDSYTCMKCGDKSSGENGGVELNAHHIANWKDNEDLRYDVDNGITLCSCCHMKFHSIYGKRNNTVEQINEFICN